MLLFLAAAIASTNVVVGSADINGSQTQLSSLSLTAVTHTAVTQTAVTQTAVTQTAVTQNLCTLTHQPGQLPPGTLVNEHELALTLDGAIVVVDLRDCSQRELMTGVIDNQAPVVVDVEGQTQIVAVRELDASPQGATFDVVAVPLRGGSLEVLASRFALWVSPARGARTLHELRFLLAEPDGRFHLDKLDQGDFVVDVDLGPGVFRSAVVVGAELLVEVEDRNIQRSRLRDRPGKTLVRGLPGLSPVSTTAWSSASSASLSFASSLAVSTGLKDGSVLVDGVQRQSGRAGVARPQALGDDVVVAWLDRGAALPGELWAIAARKSTLLLAPPPRTAVKVYGLRETR